MPVPLLAIDHGEEEEGKGQSNMELSYVLFFSVFFLVLGGL